MFVIAGGPIKVTFGSEVVTDARNHRGGSWSTAFARTEDDAIAISRLPIGIDHTLEEGADRGRFAADQLPTEKE